MVYIYNPHARSTFVSECTPLIAPFLTPSLSSLTPNISFHKEPFALAEGS